MVSTCSWMTHAPTILTPMGPISCPPSRYRPCTVQIYSQGSAWPWPAKTFHIGGCLHASSHLLSLSISLAFNSRRCSPVQCLPRMAADLRSVTTRHREWMLNNAKEEHLTPILSMTFLSRMLRVHAQVNGDYTTPPLSKGTYTYACQVPGHWYVLARPDACALR